MFARRDDIRPGAAVGRGPRDENEETTPYSCGLSALTEPTRVSVSIAAGETESAPKPAEDIRADAALGAQ